MKQKWISWLGIILILMGSLYLHVKHVDWNFENVLHHKTYKLVGDQTGYDKTVRQLIEKGIFGYKNGSYSEQSNAFITPGYPLFLAAVYQTFGYDDEGPFVQIQIIQTGFDLASCFLLWLIARNIIKNNYLPLLAPLLFAVNPSFVMLSSYIFTESIYVFTSLLFVYFLVKYLKNPEKNYIYALLTGVSFGVSILIRPAVVPFLIIIIFSMTGLAFRNRKIFKTLSILILSFGLTMSPWVIRNALTLHAFIPLAEQVGSPLLIGSYPYEANPPIDETLSVEEMKQEAISRIQTGFSKQPILYAKWYTIGKITDMIKTPYVGYFSYGGMLGFKAGTISKIYQFVIPFALLALLYIMIRNIRKDKTIFFISSFGLFSLAIYLPFIGLTRYFVPTIPFCILGILLVLDLLFENRIYKFNQA